MSPTRIKTIRHRPMGTTIIRIWDRLDSGGNGNTGTEITRIHPFSTRTIPTVQVTGGGDSYTQERRNNN